MAPSQFWWVQPAVVLLGILVAVAAIWWNRHVARLKATLDLIEGSESKDFYQVRYKAFRQYRRDAEYKAQVLSEERDEQAQDKRTKCLDFLNHYELVAIACRAGIIDEKFYMLWMGPALLRDWAEGAELVRGARAPDHPGDPGSPESYAELERLVGRWRGRRLH